MNRTHIAWMLEDMKKRDKAIGIKEDNFMYYPYKQIAKALKDYLGRTDDYCVLYTIQDKETLMVLHKKNWIRIYFEQIKDFL